MAKKDKGTPKALTESQFSNGHTIRYIDDADSLANRESLIDANAVNGQQQQVVAATGGKPPKKYRPREQWRNKAEFVLSSIAFAVGLGNVWR